ncbi:HPr family phosphocarrier protein [Magnetovibrio sp. PR-2]|uniref:HPr family phosphocarrier protein n=1 Tax=Magnetovibrio sp. PR-2 TaxID=3120356 RepID=UPI002FCE3537
MTDTTPIERSLNICNERGLHARAAAKFVKLAAEFDADITVSKDGQSVSGGSIMGLMMLAAGIGSSISVSISGVESASAMDAIAELIANKFGEEC